MLPATVPVDSVTVDELVRLTQSSATPQKSLEKDLLAEIERTPPGITFDGDDLDYEIPPVVQSGAVPHAPPPPQSVSRRGKSRGRKSEAFSRTESAWLQWQNSVYDSLFVGSHNGDSSVIVPFTLASGFNVNVGDIVDKKTVNRHITQLQDELSFENKQGILNAVLNPPTKSKRVTTGDGNGSRPSSRRRHTDDDGEKSISTIGSNPSVISRAIDGVSHHSGNFNTPSPSNKNEPMQSPIFKENGNHIYRRERIDSSQAQPDMQPVITPAAFFRQDSALPDEATTLFDKRRAFTHGPGNPLQV